MRKENISGKSIKKINLQPPWWNFSRHPHFRKKEHFFWPRMNNFFRSSNQTIRVEPRLKNFIPAYWCSRSNPGNSRFQLMSIVEISTLFGFYFILFCNFRKLLHFVYLAFFHPTLLYTKLWKQKEITRFEFF